MSELLAPLFKLIPAPARGWVVATIAVSALFWRLVALSTALEEHKAQHVRESARIAASLDKLTDTMGRVVPQVEAEVAIAQAQATDAKSAAAQAVSAVMGAEADDRFAGRRIERGR